jgi:glycosyltransferase involved in cell wall biosynthesis
LRILHLQTGGGDTGGIANYISDLLGSSTSSNFTHYVAVGDNYSGAIHYSQASTVASPSSYSAASLIAAVRQLRRLVVENDIDLIHSHALRAGILATILAILFRTPFIHTNHGLRYMQKSRFIERVVFFFLEAFVCVAAKRICCIRAFDERILKRIFFFQRSSIVTIPTLIRSSSDLSQQYKPSLTVRVVGAGRLVQFKRPDIFVDWVSALVAAGNGYLEAAWLGDGPLMERTRALSMRYSSQIEWRGYTDRNQVLRSLAEADYLLLTSDYEVFPLVALEANSVGTPVVIRHYPGCEDVIEHGINGLIFAPNCLADEVAEELYRIRENTDLYLTLRKTSHSHFSSRSLVGETMWQKYSSIYEATVR